MVSLFTFLGLSQLEDSFVFKFQGMLGCFLGARVGFFLNISHILFLEHLRVLSLFLGNTLLNRQWFDNSRVDIDINHKLLPNTSEKYPQFPEQDAANIPRMNE